MITAKKGPSIQTLGVRVKYGITEKKKAEIDSLTLDVLDAQHEVDQFQAIVTSLTQKLNNFQAYLALADNSRTLALNNKNMKDQLVQSAKDLEANSGIAFGEVTSARVKAMELGRLMKTVMEELIYSVDIINKLANLVISKKTLNPLISDELVSTISTAGNDANNSVALTLVALKSSYAAQAANMESEGAGSLENIQALSLYHSLTYKSPENGSASKTKDSSDDEGSAGKKSLSTLLDQAYANSKKIFDLTQKACDITTTQLNQASLALNKAQVNLKSLQSGLSAANAAALAS